ncbi:glycosyltransferase [Neobacillus sp. 179-J 1A1 HS]|uniref:glycosyltransferase n=1 Tax=Neobacillus driksii TaxID=3035913 RepID=UPI0035BC5E2B
MNQRVFICTGDSFPHGNAGANYIQYLALALMEQQVEVVILAQVKEGIVGQNQTEAFYQGIRYINYEEKRFSKVPVFNRSGITVQKILQERYQINSSDHLILYSADYFFLNPLITFSKKRQIPVHVCVTEHIPSYFYKYGIFNMNFLLREYTHRQIIPKATSIFPISQYLDNYFKSKNCRTLILPPMSDPFEYILNNKKLNQNIHLIYPSPPSKKDSLVTMLQGIVLLNNEERARITLHLTGSSKQRLKDVLEQDSGLVDELESNLIIHPWLTYPQLVKLYQSVDYLYFAREKNQLTIANFPSKVPELLAHGVVPICSNVGDFATYLTDNKNAIIMEGCEADVCCKSLQRVLKLDIKQRKMMRDNARKTAENVFSFKNWGSKLCSHMEVRND